MQSIGSINIIENFISKDTCNFIINYYKNSFFENPETKKGILGGPSTGIGYGLELGPGKTPFPNYVENNINHNLVSDLVTLTINGIAREVSDFYKERVSARTVFFSKMLEGSSLNEHYDNYLNDGTQFYPYGSEKTVIEKLGFQEDYSALLYLNDNYTGGEIGFPQNNIEFKPSAGTLIFFKGNKESMHYVNEIISGERINIVSFYWSTDYREKYFKEIDYKIV